MNAGGGVAGGGWRGGRAGPRQFDVGAAEIERLQGMRRRGAVDPAGGEPHRRGGDGGRHFGHVSVPQAIRPDGAVPGRRVADDRHRAAARQRGDLVGGLLRSRHFRRDRHV